MYDSNGVVVDKKNNKVYYGTEQIKEMLYSFLKMGKVEYKTLRRVIHDLGGEKFYVDVDFVMTYADAGLELKGSSEHIFHKKEGQWKCVYECVLMQ